MRQWTLEAIAEDKAMQWVTRGLDWEMNLKNGIPKGYPAMIGEFGVYAKVDHASALKFIEHQTSEGGTFKKGITS